MFGSIKLVWWMIAVLVMITAAADSRLPVRHNVGGKIGWTDDKINYTEWAIHETPPFYVGDWLYFKYERDRYNVLQVNKTSYEQCIDHDFIKNISTGHGRDVFNLTEAKTFYFLSSGGYCYNGMKLSVHAIDYSQSAPAPAPDDTAFASPPMHTIVNYMVFPILLTTIIFLLN